MNQFEHFVGFWCILRGILILKNLWLHCPSVSAVSSPVSGFSVFVRWGATSDH